MYETGAVIPQPVPRDPHRGQVGPASPLLVFVFVLAAVAGLAREASAHEPAFGFGADALHCGGIALEATTRIEERAATDTIDAGLGISDVVRVHVAVPFVVRSDGPARRSGPGDATVRAAWQAMRRRSPEYAFIRGGLVFGVKLPTGDPHGGVRLGTGSTDWFGAVAAAADGAWWTVGGDASYRLTTEVAGRKEGETLAWNAGAGPRWAGDGLASSLRLTMHGTHAGSDSFEGTPIRATGGAMLFAGTDAELVMRRVRLKGGVRVPLRPFRRGPDGVVDWALVAGAEIHR